MTDFNQRFGENGKLSPMRAGTIVAILCLGTLIGCLTTAGLCDWIGRRKTIILAAVVYIMGVVIEVTSMTSHIQFTTGRTVAGLGIGALSTAVPMYQSESVPKTIRGVVIASYQLMITLGILVSYVVCRHP